MDMPIWVTAAVKAAARGTFAIFTGAVLLSSLPTAAEAGWFSRNSAPKPATFQAEGGFHRGPSGYHRMCAREPEYCRHDAAAAEDQGVSAPGNLDDARWKELVSINSDFNWRIRPVEDRGPDHWTMGRRYGDCEDYAIAKKHALIAAGWAPDQLLYAVVEGRRSPYHLVLIVRTDKGDYVLDNLTDRIRPWQDSGYKFIVRQRAENPTKWAYVTGAGDRLAQVGRPNVITR